MIRAILTGENDELGQIPAADVAKLILGLQQALAAAASTVVRQRRRGATGRHPAAIEAASRLTFQGVERGSVAAVFSLPDLAADDGEKLDVGDIPDLARLAFERLIDALHDPAPDPAMARAVARLSNELNVGGGGRTLRLVGGHGRSGVVDHDVRQRMNRYARERPMEREDHVVGSLVEADFEKKTARLQPAAGPPVTVSFPDDLADLVHGSLRNITEVAGHVTYDPKTHLPARVEVAQVMLAAPLDFGDDSFWHHQTAEELAQEQGNTEPQRIEDLHTDLDLTPEEIEAFFAVVDE